MSGKARAEAEDVLDIFEWKFPVVAFGKSGEIRDTCVERGSGWAAAFGVGAMAGSAVLLEHGFAGGDVAGWKLRFVVPTGSWIFLGSNFKGKNQETKRKETMDGHGLLLVRPLRLFLSPT